MEVAELLAKKDAAIETVNTLFISTDKRDWTKIEEIFQEEIFFDMSSLGGADGAMVKATAITAMWQEGLKDLDHVHHQSGNFFVDMESDVQAKVFCYGTAYHHKDGVIKVFVGSYDVVLEMSESGVWKIALLRYNSKFVWGS